MPVHSNTLYLGVFLILWLWAIINCILTEHIRASQKVLLMLCLLIVPPIGTLIYLLFTLRLHLDRKRLAKQARDTNPIATNTPPASYEEGYHAEIMLPKRDAYENQPMPKDSEQYESPLAIYPEQQQD